MQLLKLKWLPVRSEMIRSFVSSICSIRFADCSSRRKKVQHDTFQKNDKKTHTEIVEDNIMRTRRDGTVARASQQAKSEQSREKNTFLLWAKNVNSIVV